MRSYQFAFLLALCMCSITMAAQQAEEVMVVFTQPGDAHFRTGTLPLLRDFAAQNDMLFLEREARLGLPEEITTTPAIVYQNQRGRSIYASRYAELSTIKNFVRTSRISAQSETRLSRKNCLIKKMGRATLYVQFKVTGLTGEVPKGFSQEAFRTEVQEVVSRHMTGFSRAAETCLQRTDRAFYLDLHPYLDAAGKLLLTVEVYSQFSCRIPVYSLAGTPLTGTLDEQEKVLAEAGALLAETLARQIRESTIGDAFTPVPSDVPHLPWDSVSPPIAGGITPQAGGPLRLETAPKQWTSCRALDAKTPVVAFRFAAPLDRYAGEVRQISGHLNFSADFSRITGRFEADMQTLTMGMQSFDENVLNKYIKAFRFPKATFAFDAPFTLPPAGSGQSIELEVTGTFELMRKKRPVTVKAILTPIRDQSGQPALVVNVNFQLNIVDDFKIKGPEGPDPARKTMLFDLNFLMNNL